MRATNRVYGYCPDCETHQDSQSTVQRDRLASFCPDCGTELREMDYDEYVEILRSEQVSWPIEVTFDVPVSLQGDHSYRIKEAADVELLPFNGQDEYHFDVRLGNVPVTVEIAEDGTYDIVDIGDL